MAQARIKRSLIKQLGYSLRYRFGEYAVRGFVNTMPWIPCRLLIRLTSFCAWVTYVVLWKYRVRMEQNLAQTKIGGDMTRAARKGLTWRAWFNLARTVLDTGAMIHFSKEQTISVISLQGEEYLRRALVRGKGVIALSAHLGAFSLIGARLHAAGYPFSAVVKLPRHARFARLIQHYCTRLGVETISARPRAKAVRGMIKALRENRVVLVIADEFKAKGVGVSFLGRPMAVPRGPASLALRTGAVTLPMFALRRPDGSICLSIEPEIPPVEAEDVSTRVAATTALFTRRLEEAIWSNPDQWNWLGFPRNGKALVGEHARAGSVANRLPS